MSFRFPLFRVSWRRTIQGIGTLFLTTIAIGGLYQTVCLFRERSAFPMPGRLVDVGGYKMHIYCTGQGSPAVILDSGLGDSFISWQSVQPQISSFVRVCSYDRAGMGYSEASPRPRTSYVLAEELHQLLHNAGIAPPYILAGHSMAAYNIRLYASLFKSDVAGIVLVDGCHPAQLNRFPRALDAMNPGWIRQGTFLEFTMPILVCWDTAEIVRRYARPNVRSTMPAKMPPNARHFVRVLHWLRTPHSPLIFRSLSSLTIRVCGTRVFPLMLIELQTRHGSRCRRSLAIFQVVEHGSSPREVGTISRMTDRMS